MKKQKTTSGNASSDSDFLIGGQAVIEGVMIKGREHYAVAVREDNGKIKVLCREFVPLHKKVPFFKTHFIRGIGVLYQMTKIGISALNWSASLQEHTTIQGKKGGKPSGSKRAESVATMLTVLVGLLFALALFKAAPLAIAKTLSSLFPLLSNAFLFNLIDGLMRIAIFLLYLLIISRIGEIKRMFQYHGAEHMTIACLEHRKPLLYSSIKRFSPQHPRCGTSFILIVLFVSIFLFSIVPTSLPYWQLLLFRIPIILPIAGISYEVLKASASRPESAFFRMVSLPGLWLQRITTASPDKSQVETAVAALKALLKKEPVSSLAGK